jgi:hypothetical protein
MYKITIFISLLTVLFFQLLKAQDDIQIGSPNADRTSTGGLYDYSDPAGVNFRVQLWGYVKFPGFYIVPAGTSVNELISLAGGPLEDAILDDIRLIKLKEGSQTVMEKYNINDFVWEDKITKQIKYCRLNAGDIVVVPGAPRYFVREDITFYVGLLTSLISIASLVVSLIILSKQ